MLSLIHFIAARLRLRKIVSLEGDYLSSTEISLWRVVLIVGLLFDTYLPEVLVKSV